MLYLCVCRDMRHLGSSESTQKARVANVWFVHNFLELFIFHQLCNAPMYDSSLYSTFARTKVQLEIPKLSQGLVKLLKEFNWSQVAVLYENTARVIEYKEAVVKEFSKQDIKVLFQEYLLTYRYVLLLLGIKYFQSPFSAINTLQTYINAAGGFLQSNETSCTGALQVLLYF